MAELHEALACLRPKEFSDVPTDNLEAFLPDILAKAEIIANRKVSDVELFNQQVADKTLGG